MDLLIRPMILGDLEAVFALDRQTASAPHWSRADYSAVLDAPDDPVLRRFGLVAELAGKVVGFAVLRVLTASDGSEAELESIVVAQDLRGKGIGTELLAETVLKARSQQAERLELEVRASNLAAIRLYMRAGFSETGRRPSYYSDPREDAILLGIAW